jgi:hypothetical protein
MPDLTNWNADDWHLFLSQHLFDRPNQYNALATVALKIADTIDAVRNAQTALDSAAQLAIDRQKVRTPADLARLASDLVTAGESEYALPDPPTGSESPSAPALSSSQNDAESSRTVMPAAAGADPEWQTIESAPIGKRFLAYVPIDKIRLFIALKTRDGLILDEMMRPMHWPPTHWRPLPARPHSQEATEPKR